MTNNRNLLDEAKNLLKNARDLQRKIRKRIADGPSMSGREKKLLDNLSLMVDQWTKTAKTYLDDL